MNSLGGFMCNSKCAKFSKLIPLVISIFAFIVLAIGNNTGVDHLGYAVSSSLEEVQEELLEDLELRDVAYKVPSPKQSHVSAVGIVQIRAHHRYADRGTATLVEPNIAVSAAHVFKNVLPRVSSIRSTGPIHVDLRNTPVHWHYQPADGSPRKNVRVLSLVVDSRFIQAQDLSRTDRLSHDAQKHDLVFIELDPQSMPRGAVHVPMVSRGSDVGQMCASYGYGVDSRWDRPKRQSIVYHLTLPQVSYDHDVIILSNQDNQPRGDYRRAVWEVSLLTGRQGLAPHQAYVGQARPGDSGGPLFAVTPKGIRVIGVMSLYGALPVGHEIFYYNGFCSLISGDRQKGYSLSFRAKEMLDLLKRNRVSRGR